MVDSQLSARALESLLGDWRGGGNAYVALFDRIRVLALDGRIPTDSRLPAERELSARLGLSRTTVSAAYRQLREAGFLVSQRGSGSLITLPVTPTGLVSVASAGILDFGKATMSALPGLADVAALAVSDLPRHLESSGFDPVGIPELRLAIADRYTARGLPTDPQQIMVTIGAQHAISLLAHVLVGRGDRALIESPTYPHAYEALREAGARLVPVSVTPAMLGEDESVAGWDEDGLIQAIQRSNPALGYLMPDFHNPTGLSMPAAQRERVLAAATRQGTVLIADETIAELNIDRPESFLPFAAYAPAGSTGSVVSVGSVGKTVWGGLRVGWIRAERPLIRKLVAARSARDLGTPIIDQLIVARLLGDMPAILAERTEVLRAGRDHLTQALATQFPDWHVPEVHGGITTWVNLGSPVSSQLSLAARSQGLVIPAGPRFGIDGAFERFLRIPFCYGFDEIDRGVAALGRAWESLLRHPVPETDYLADVV
ncbi:PLP-dependent aminotransferase family protein [Leifsonia sp. A12D58]|uniref:MocR-like transcription factor YczR n=1 Tax=Leifsonia sp. A12D58 TaxID=3397674 RepID=UPI0039E03C81